MYNNNKRACACGKLDDDDDDKMNTLALINFLLAKIFPTDLSKFSVKILLHTVVYEAVKILRYRPTSCQWLGTPFPRYYKLWSQFTLCDGVLCQQYTPQPLETMVTVPILPQCLQRQAYSNATKGVNKTFELQIFVKKHIGST